MEHRARKEVDKAAARYTTGRHKKKPTASSA